MYRKFPNYDLDVSSIEAAISHDLVLRPCHFKVVKNKVERLLPSSSGTTFVSCTVMLAEFILKESSS